MKKFSRWWVHYFFWAAVGLSGLGAKEEIVGGDTFQEDFQRVQSVLRTVPKQVLPSVVQLNISALKDSPANPNFLFEFFNNKQKAPEEPRKYRSAVMGSGVIFRQESGEGQGTQEEARKFFLITNNHVVEDANEIEVITHDERKFPGKIVGRDERVDLAVLSFEAGKEEARSLRPATFGDSSGLEIGDWVMAIGSPNGFRSSVTMGIVSYIGRHGGPGQNINDFIQTDAAINHGNSGGPLVNMRGEVIGINTWIASESGSNAGLGFAIPVNNTKYIIESFLKEGRVRYGWLGIVMQEYSRILNRISPKIERSVLRGYGVYSRKGVFITSVYEHSPADKAGLKPGDFVMAINGKKISSSQELSFSIGIIPPGREARLQILRAEESSEIPIVLGERKEGELLDAESHRTWPGLDVIPLDTEVIQALQELGPNLRAADEKSEGLWVLRVIPQSSGDMAGLRQNDVITKMNGIHVRSLKDFYRILNEVGPQGDLIYTYEREGKESRTSKL
ncbi:MAG: trypsin-like peptidase domain-containing protein [Spirochaetota bacterium]